MEGCDDKLDKLHRAALQSRSFRQRVTRRFNTTSTIRNAPPSASSTTLSSQTPTKPANISKPGFSSDLFNDVQPPQHPGKAQYINHRIARNTVPTEYSHSSRDLRLDCEEGPSCKYVLRPDHRFRSAWDFVILICLMYVATISIFVYSFYGNLFLGTKSARMSSEATEAYKVGWFWIERILDVIFLIDIVLNFFTAYEKDGAFVTHLPSIRRRYLRTWFLLDLVAVIPWDVFAELLNDHANASETEVHLLLFPRMLRLIRLVRFIRLVRILRMKESFRKFEVKFRLKGGHLRLASLIITVLLLVHWFACLFFFFGNINQTWDNDKYLPWLETDKTDTPADDPADRGRTAYGTGRYDEYLAALYFSVYTITTIGYGDVVPRTTIDRTYTTIIMLIGAACFAYVISQVSELSGELNTVKVEHRQRMDSLIDMAKSRNLPDWLVCDIKRFLDRENIRQRISDEKALLDAMSRDLRVKVLKRMYGTHLEESKLLEGIPPSHLATIYENLSEKIFREGDFLYRKGQKADNFFVIIRGNVKLVDELEDPKEDEGEEKTDGDIVGEKQVLFHRQRKCSAYCSSDTDVVVVPRDAVMEVLLAHRDKLEKRRQEQARELWYDTISLVEKQIRFKNMANKLKSRAILHNRGNEMDKLNAVNKTTTDDDEGSDSGSTQPAMSERRESTGSRPELQLDNDDMARVQDLEEELDRMKNALTEMLRSLERVRTGRSGDNDRLE